jgi:predicted metal-dependent phosphoesterase TrpH
MKTAFSQYLKRGRCGYVRTQWVELEKGLQILKQAGGVCVLAHPKKYQFTRTKLRELLRDFKQFGGHALEVISGQTSADDVKHLKTLCQEFDLLASCGSDFHGVESTPYAMKRLSNATAPCRALMDSPLMEKYQ